MMIKIEGHKSLEVVDNRVIITPKTVDLLGVYESDIPVVREVIIGDFNDLTTWTITKSPVRFTITQ